jgi:hypothetical protein
MEAQTEQAFLAITQGNASEEPTVKIVEYKDMEPFFVKGERATSLEQQQLTERAKHHKKSVKVRNDASREAGRPNDS